LWDTGTFRRLERSVCAFADGEEELRAKAQGEGREFGWTTAARPALAFPESAILELGFVREFRIFFASKSPIPDPASAELPSGRFRLNMPALRFISLLIALTGCVPLARAGRLDWLFHHDVEVIVNTDITPEGAKLPPASTEHPIYYFGVSLGYRDLGGFIAGDKLPSKETMYSWIAKALAKQGYLPADAAHPPTQVMAFAWGSLYVRWFFGNPDMPIQMNRGGMLRFIGGEKMGLISKYPTMPEIEFVPELHYLQPAAERFLTAGRDDLYMAVLLGYDLQAALHKERRLLWRTRIACPSRGLVMADTLPTMVSIAAPLIARETKVPAWIRASDKYTPVITIGDPVVEEYLSSGPLPIVDESNSQSGKPKKSKK
jgi:hypothetical protein